MLPSAIILTGGALDTPYAKTAHGLLRYSKRYRIAAIIDQKFAGEDPGLIIGDAPSKVPIFADLERFFDTGGQAKYCIIGRVNAGGVFPPELISQTLEAIGRGLSVVSGMHQYLSDFPEIVKAAEKHGVELIDVRRPKAPDELHFWTGAVSEIGCPIIPVMGTDCAVGKRTLARLLEQALTEKGLNAEMIYTGQTGWMQGGRYGFVFDATLNDFVSGELEHALVSCWREVRPDVILIEGQASLRNPSGPCGSEFLVSGRADGVVLIHAPGRIYHKGWEKEGYLLPEVDSEIKLIRSYGVEVLGLGLNTARIEKKPAMKKQDAYQRELQIPVVRPLEEGVERLLPPILELIHQNRTA